MGMMRVDQGGRIRRNPRGIVIDLVGRHQERIVIDWVEHPQEMNEIDRGGAQQEMINQEGQEMTNQSLIIRRGIGRVQIQSIIGQNNHLMEKGTGVEIVLQGGRIQIVHLIIEREIGVLNRNVHVSPHQDISGTAVPRLAVVEMKLRVGAAEMRGARMNVADMKVERKGTEIEMIVLDARRVERSVIAMKVEALLIEETRAVLLIISALRAVRMNVLVAQSRRI